MRRLFFLLLAASAMAACNFTVKKNDDAATSSDNGSVRNNISLKASGITVQQAFLLFDDGKLVPGDNKIEVGQNVRMRLIIDGWEPVNGKVALGASEKITTDDGQVILNSEDLFATVGEVDAKDAGVITLSAVITKVDKLFKYFEVTFRVWDKNSSDNATGSYKLYLK